MYNQLNKIQYNCFHSFPSYGQVVGSVSFSDGIFNVKTRLLETAQVPLNLFRLNKKKAGGGGGEVLPLVD